MAIVFQYGSNMSIDRLNSPDRLDGHAKYLGIAYTSDNFELVFDLWSKTNDCAVANLLAGSGRSICGVLYEVPDQLITRETAGNNRSLDEIEGEGTNYRRQDIQLRYPMGEIVNFPVLTYIGLYHRKGIQTSEVYAAHILKGLFDHDIPREYVAYVKARISDNNPSILIKQG